MEEAPEPFATDDDVGRREEEMKSTASLSELNFLNFALEISVGYTSYGSGYMVWREGKKGKKG